MTQLPHHVAHGDPKPPQCHLDSLRLILPFPQVMPAADPDPSSPPAASDLPDPLPHSFPLSFLNFLTRSTVQPIYRTLTATSLSISPPSPSTAPSAAPAAAPLPAPSPPLIPFSNSHNLPSTIKYVAPPGPTDHLTYSTKARYPPPDPLTPLPSEPNSPRLIHVSLIARHGTRNPTNSSLTRMNALNSWLHSAFPKPPTWLREWSSVLAEYRRAPGALTAHGVGDLHSIAARFARLYAPALSRKRRPTLRIRSSYKDRAIASAQAFLDGYLQACRTDALPEPVLLLHESPDSEAEHCHSPPPRPPSPPSSSSSDIDLDAEPDQYGLPCKDENARVEVLPFGRDAILRYYDRNVEYANFAMQHKALTRRDLSRGALRRHGAALAARLSAALGASTPMDSDLVRSLTEAAAFDAAHGRGDTSVFCRAIAPRDVWLLELFERRHRPFFKAHERFRTVSAPLVEDLVASLNASVGMPCAERSVAADLRFAHAETLIPLLLLLGITANGLDPSDPEYKRGLGAMSPFAANLALELYEVTPPGGGKSHVVRFRLHERYIQRIPALGERGETGVVQLDHLLEFFESVLDEGLPNRRK